MSKLAMSNIHFYSKLSRKPSKYISFGMKPNIFCITFVVVSNIILNMYVSFVNGNQPLYASSKIQIIKLMTWDFNGHCKRLPSVNMGHCCIYFDLCQNFFQHLIILYKLGFVDWNVITFIKKELFQVPILINISFQSTTFVSLVCAYRKLCHGIINALFCPFSKFYAKMQFKSIL